MVVHRSARSNIKNLLCATGKPLQHPTCGAASIAHMIGLSEPLFKHRCDTLPSKLIGKVMSKSFINAAFFFFVSSAIFLLGLVCAYAFKDPAPGDWWSPLSSLATVAAVVVALWTATNQRRDAIDRERQGDAAVLLGFQQLVKEVARMCTLSGFQSDSDANPIIYPDISTEFEAVAAMLAALPMERLAVHGQVSRSMHVRRIASEMSMLWKGKNKRDGSVFKSNRDKMFDLTTRARTESIAIAAYLKIFDPVLYAKNEPEIEKL
jgi:hypothetical protein